MFDNELNPFLPIQLLVSQSVYCKVTYELQREYAIVPVQNLHAV